MEVLTLTLRDIVYLRSGSLRYEFTDATGREIVKIVKPKTIDLPPSKSGTPRRMEIPDWFRDPLLACRTTKNTDPFMPRLDDIFFVRAKVVRSHTFKNFVLVGGVTPPGTHKTHKNTN